MARRSRRPTRGARPGERRRVQPLSRAEAWPALLASGATLVLCVPRLCPTLCLMGDSAIFVSAAAGLGVPQPPGYPLYSLLGHLATLLPVGELPWRVHLTSAIYHSLTAGVVALLIQRCTGSRVAALAGALTLASFRAFLLGSLYAEVFPLNDLFTALLLLLGVEFVACSAHPGPARDSPGRLAGAPGRALAGLFLTAGVASAHHQMISLCAPALLLLVACGQWRLLVDVARLTRLALLFLAPLLGLYAWLWIAARRAPTPNWGELQSLPDLWRLVTREDYGGVLSPFLGASGSDAARQVTVYAESLARSLGVAGATLVVVGAVSLWRRRFDVTLALVVLGLVAGPLFAILNSLPVGDETGVAFAERFLTMSLVPLGVLAGAGVAALQTGLSVVVPARAATLIAGLCFTLPLAGSWDVDLRRDQRGRDFALDAYTAPEDGALVLVTGDASNHAATYWCEVLKACGSRIVLSPGQLHLPWRRAQVARQYPQLSIPPPRARFVTTLELIAANVEQRPVYVAPLLLEREPGLRDAFGYLPDQLWLRVVTESSIAVERERFLLRARRFAVAEGCAGCALRRDQLLFPSLEAGIVQSYVDAFVNHARIVRAYFQDESLAAQLERRALAIDPHAAHQYF